ncbi:hypothetical protein ELI30_09470 [Rhizobium leguminosarum]|uniref:hypothetical protein n=1 Tax=Rhizobium leguminosarum TaxID=384 RepID=UPI001030B6A5|nr:hypothetical protein [Rhizobium leguminosarum]TAV48513.1 hypothetical protein ELI32_09925 [Rhizobium leguminosarum]TAV58013.1 hypothetical protein ELI31_09455 [Rhizobium leguminosarum]TAV68954.1 hypothetical protein ELI30_09470 [Rhizobium leguminosarum]
MKVTDATLDRIQQRREKLERKGVLKEEIPGSNVAAFHLWQVDENGLLEACHLLHEEDEDGCHTRPGEHEGAGLTMVMIPAGKFLPGPEKIPTESGQLVNVLPPLLFETPEMWAEACKDGFVLPDRRIRLTDAPSPPEEFPTADIERVPDGVIGATGGDPNARDRPLALRPEEIDRDAAIADFEKHRRKRDGDTPPVTPKHKPKPKTFEEHTSRVREEMLAKFEAERLAQQKQETKAPLNMAMAPTIKDWKGY